MTARLEAYCQNISVGVVSEGFIEYRSLLPHEQDYAGFDRHQSYWLRDIILYGDGVPWLAGRTVLPESTLSGPELALTSLGECPLGRYLFSSPLLSRDFILPGKNDDLWGRYSLLRLSGKPLMLTETFLPLSPLYLAGAKG
ncbi:chorismate lyase [Tatumella punctata]